MLPGAASNSERGRGLHLGRLQQAHAAVRGARVADFSRSSSVAPTSLCLVFSYSCTVKPVICVRVTCCNPVHLAHGYLRSVLNLFLLKEIRAFGTFSKKKNLQG